MKTDKEIHELFASEPAELYRLLDRPYPPGGAEVRVEQFKQVEQTSDLIAFPVDLAEPVIIFEFQAQRAENLHARGILAAGLLLQSYPERECEAHVVYFSRSKDPYAGQAGPCRNFAPFVHYLDERLREVADQEPMHPLVSVFFPLLETDPAKLQTGFRRHYANLKQTAELPEETRAHWCDVYQLWLMRALGMDNLEEIRMILLEDLPQVEDTVWGRELKEIWSQQALEVGREEGEITGQIRILQKDLRKYQQMFSEGKISQEAFDLLSRDVQLQLDALRTED